MTGVRFSGSAQFGSSAFVYLQYALQFCWHVREGPLPYPSAAPRPQLYFLLFLVAGLS